ncbi:MAG: agmatine deiminase family protein [Nitrososphaeraceae archaeon]
MTGDLLLKLIWHDRKRILITITSSLFVIILGFYYPSILDFIKDTKNDIFKIKVFGEFTQTMNLQKNKMYLILAAPSIHDKYYKNYFNEIVNFQVEYAKKIIQHNTDNIRILVDSDTKNYYEERLPSETLITEEMYDIWIRDFATINPENPVQFIYTNASMSKIDSIKTQEKFLNFAKKYSIKIEKISYIIDGGNIVDNYDGKIITTTRFLEDNSLQYNEGKKILKELLKANEVAIIEPDDDILAHADGMVAWIDKNVLAVNDYSKLDSEFHSIVINELQNSFPNTKIVTVPVSFDKKDEIDQTKGIGSACGINLNLVSTYTTLYVPVFGNDYENQALEIIKNNTSKEIIKIDAKNICIFGGSVRCTTWQITEINAEEF